MTEMNRRSAWDRVTMARRPERTRAEFYVKALFDEFTELHGDRCFGDDRALLSGLGFFEGRPVTILAQNRGQNIQENIDRNFGMMQPEG